jgi:hypothetical protein
MAAEQAPLAPSPHRAVQGGGSCGSFYSVAVSLVKVLKQWGSYSLAIVSVEQQQLPTIVHLK